MNHDQHDHEHAHHAAAGHQREAHDKHAGHSVAMFRDRFWVSLALTLPTLVWGHMLPRAFGFTPPAVPGARWIPAVFGTLVFAYGGRPFLDGAVRELRARLPGMMTLIALAISVAFLFSASVTLGFAGMPLWEELSTLVTIMVLGHWIEMRSITQAQTTRSRTQALADRAAFLLTLVALVAGAFTLVGWLLADAEPAYAIERFVAVLVIACPHALGLAVPLVIAISTTLGARGGLLVRDRRGLEEARNLTTVVFDKTGTLTLGEHRVVAMRVTGNMGESDALRLAAGVERDAEHPVARAIVASATERRLLIPAASDFRTEPGRGATALIDGRRVAVGGPNMLVHAGTAPPAALQAFADEAGARGQGVVYLLEDDHVLAAVAVADAVRPESAEAVQRLHDQGIEVAMLTGDAKPVADAVARELGIDRVFAQVLPEQKAAHVEALQRAGKRVAMVGDGVNDAPALVTADVGIAIGAGTDVAVEAGDIVLVRSDPRDVARIVGLSRASYRKMLQNLWWAAGYNIVAIPAAAGVFVRWGITLSPAAAAVLMSASTVVVAINAQLLRRARL